MPKGFDRYIISNLEQGILRASRNYQGIDDMNQWTKALPLFLQLLVLLTREVTTDVGLEPRDDLAQPVITKLFHLTQDTSAEEHLLIRFKCYQRKLPYFFCHIPIKYRHLQR